MTETLGYALEPFDDAHALGYRALSFNLYDTPTGRHFDPEHAVVTAVTREGVAGRLTLGRPWLAPEDVRVCPGRVQLLDRSRHSVDMFTFGGRLTADDHGDHTACRLESPAPIFHAFPGEVLSAMLLEEFAALLAQRSAHWAADPAEFARRRAAAEPAILYAVAVAEVLARIGQIPTDRKPDDYRAAEVALREEGRRLAAAGAWRDPLPSLDDIL